MTATARTFTWLHLTDLHCGLRFGRHLWGNLKNVFLDDIAKLHEVLGPIDAVLFTGDLTQSGTEFDELDNTALGPIMETLHTLGSRPCFLAVPGNHDLIRPFSKPPSAVLRQLMRNDGFSEIADEFWENRDSEYRELVESAFATYSHWWTRSSSSLGAQLQNGLLPGDFTATLSSGDGSGLDVGIAGVNTAFLQLTSESALGRLACDPRQVLNACDNDIGGWALRHDASILLTHHSTAWLEERCRNAVYPEINPAGRFTVHLCGHMHDAATTALSVGGGAPARQWQGRSIFGLERYGEQSLQTRSHGYSVGKIALTGSVASLRLWPRVATADANGWRFVPDHQGHILNERDGGTNAEQLAASKPRTSTFPREVTTSGNGAKPLGRTNASPEVAVKQYADAVCQAHSHSRFVELPLNRDMMDLNLESLYVDPRFSSQEIQADLPPPFWPNRLSTLEVLKQHPRVVLLGDPGSGKSTLVSCISWQLCRRDRISNPWNAELKDVIPLTITLRDLRLKADVTWESLVESFLSHGAGKLLRSVDAINGLLKEGRALVLLDGLDEVGNLNVRKRLREAVQAGSAAHPSSRWLLTSRIVGYEQMPFQFNVERERTQGTEANRDTKHQKSKFADVLFLAPFDDVQITDFSKKWFSQHEKDSEIADISAKDFVDAIQENDGTQRLARVPYLLTLMVLIHHKNSRLPHGRTELYERIATAYLESIDLRRQLDQLPYSLSQKKRWLAEVA